MGGPPGPPLVAALLVALDAVVVEAPTGIAATVALGAVVLGGTTGAILGIPAPGEGAAVAALDTEEGATDTAAPLAGGSPVDDAAPTAAVPLCDVPIAAI